MSSASRPLLTAAAVGVAATTAYLEAKLHISKDLNTLGRANRGERNLLQAIRDKKGSGFFLFEKAALRRRDEQCIWSRQAEYSWTQTYQQVCQYGHYFQQHGVKPGHYVGMYFYNSPDFMFIWLGLLSIGAAPALINFNLASSALLHCVEVSGTQLLLYDSAEDCVSRIERSKNQLHAVGVECVVLDAALKAKISQYPISRPETDCFNSASFQLPLALMYTSGTTGLPKASPWTAHRQYISASLLPRPFGQRPGLGGDRTYICIPLYHGTGGLAALADMMNGVSIALAPKFSLSCFWQDCIDSEATFFVYVGEIVRYLLSVPPSSVEKKHQIRMIWGNGLSPELWSKAKDRFGITEVGEFYASTEGVLGFVNHSRNDFGTGAIGHHGCILRYKYQDILVPVRIDADTGDIWRSPDTGFAQRVTYKQGGEMLVKLQSRKAWAGYYGAEEATRKKLLQDVFAKGDFYFRTGDALRRDDNGHWYFIDRLGDTYRWKGENISTTEVTQAIGKYPNITEANVYGVKIPCHDGRAGCAAVVLASGDVDAFDWASLATMLRKELPPYAVPTFIRVRSAVGSMSTDNHKHSKVQLRLEGVEPQALGTKVPNGDSDSLLWLPAGSSKYVHFTQNDWDKLTQSRARI